MHEPKDIRYIDDRGWNDHVYRKNKDPDEFDDPAYKRISLGTLSFTLTDIIPNIEIEIKKGN